MTWSYEPFPHVADVAEAMDIDPNEKREQRKELISRANPQEGVVAIKDKFSGHKELIPGVESKNSNEN